MTSSRIVLTCATALAMAAFPGARALRAATTRIVTWGDSITYGYHDFPNSSPPSNCWDAFPDNNPPESCGFSVRLEGRLDDLAYNNPIWDVQLLNLGKGGEVTAGALTRICKWVGPNPPPPMPCDAACPVPYTGQYQINSMKHWICNGFLQPEDAFVLMEGTNDTTQNVSQETIVFNLGVLAQHATNAGFNVVLSDIIPRHPLTQAYNNQEADTQELNATLVGVASASSWPFVDAYCRMRRVGGMANSVYQNYTGWNNDGNGGTDPCGHPNRTGFDRIVCNNSGCGGGNWSWVSDPACPAVPPPMETVVKTALPPRVTLTVPGGPLTTGTSYLFSAALHDLSQTSLVTWNFGDGTVVAVVPSASPATYSHTYYVPGPYTVSATVRNPNGAVRTASQGIVLGGADLTIFVGDFETGNTSDWSSTQP